VLVTLICPKAVIGGKAAAAAGQSALNKWLATIPAAALEANVKGELGSGGGGTRVCGWVGGWVGGWVTLSVCVYVSGCFGWFCLGLSALPVCVSAERCVCVCGGGGRACVRAY
jgi:hypothetical protein